MFIILPALVVACGAFCVWLTVRIINRRERWAIRTAAAIVLLPLLYVASFGPACWWFSNVSELPHGKLSAYRMVPAFYRPIGWMARRGPAWVGRMVGWYATLGLDDYLECETEFGGQYHKISFAK
jgi:hypothetical protein